MDFNDSTLIRQSESVPLSFSDQHCQMMSEMTGLEIMTTLVVYKQLRLGIYCVLWTPMLISELLCFNNRLMYISEVMGSVYFPFYTLRFVNEDFQGIALLTQVQKARTGHVLYTAFEVMKPCIC